MQKGESKRLSPIPAQRSNGIATLTISGILVVAAYVAAQMLSDVLSLKIALVAGFSIDAGTFVYPFTFTLRDLVHKLLGRPAARAVIVTAASTHVPPPLLKQLKPGGRMVIPVGAAFRVQQLMLVTKDRDGKVTSRVIAAVRFVPLTGGAKK